MTDDLVKRLADEANLFYGSPPCGLLMEAKDRIEALRSALRSSLEACGRGTARIEALEALLEQRDAFIVSKDLWFEFVDSAALAGEKKDG